MTSIFHRLLTAVVLAVWGAVLLTICFTGRISAYLHPNFQPLALVAGCVLACLAILVLIAPAGTNAHGSRSSIRSLLTSLILVAPLLLAFSKTNDSFGASTVANRLYVEDLTQLAGTQLPEATSASGPIEGALPDDGSNDQAAYLAADDRFKLPKTADGHVRVEVVDFLYASQLPEVREQLENQPVEIIGQLMPAKTNNPKGNRLVLIRMMMSCCAADAQPVALPIEPQQMPDLPDMTWVKVTGKAAFPVEGGRFKPVIQNVVLEKIDPPDDPFLY